MSGEEAIKWITERLPCKVHAIHIKRLGLSGSGAESCPADAKRGGQDVAEERSREGGRVQSAASKPLHIPQPKPAGLGRNADLKPFERSGRLDDKDLARRALDSE